MPIASQSISTCIDISSLFPANVQDIIKCITSIDHCNVFTLLTDIGDSPKHIIAFQSTLFLSIKDPYFIDQPNLFPIPLNLRRLLLPSLTFQLPSKSEPACMLRILLPCGSTHHRSNTSCLQPSLRILLPITFSLLHSDLWRLVRYIRQLL